MRGKYTIDEIRDIVTPIAQQYGVDSLYLFGSYAKGIANEKSDIDVHVDKGKIRTLFALTGFRLALEGCIETAGRFDHKRHFGQRIFKGYCG